MPCIFRINKSVTKHPMALLIDREIFCSNKMPWLQMPGREFLGKRKAYRRATCPALLRQTTQLGLQWLHAFHRCVSFVLWLCSELKNHKQNGPPLPSFVLFQEGSDHLAALCQSQLGLRRFLWFHKNCFAEFLTCSNTAVGAGDTEVNKMVSAIRKVSLERGLMEVFAQYQEM